MEYNQNLVYQIGMTLVKGIGTVTARQIIDTLEDVSQLFKEKARLLEKIPGISHRVMAEIHNHEVLQRAEKEVQFIQKNNIQALFIQDADYPQRLKDCVDAPVMLYFRGNANLNTAKIMSFVGTRNATAYGKEMTENIIADISKTYPDALIVSGLAYGIDIQVHRSALRNALPTVGILAHGLDRIYPPVHRSAAVEMLNQGGLLTDFMSETNPDKQNFVKRNRIVAGISDCTVIIESAERGGALITAGIADSYNKDVFALPGRATDTYSVGCNKLIKYKKAALITSADDIFREMCWQEQPDNTPKIIQRSLFIDLTEEEQIIVDQLAGNDGKQLNQLCVTLNLPISKLASTLFELEMKGVVRCFAGGIYRLI
ncbi:DNA recombination-mediator protein A [Candidatus Symbiothrix dinenymphae]|nr:DNA recombination-mediator protein A [Candidatus Symbiothrix dinenymphae]